MRQAGWFEGRDFVLEERYTGTSQDQAASLAAELVQLKVDVILVLNTANAQAARRASQTIPVVMLVSGYPVEAGLAASLGRPAGNVTGLSIYAGADLWGKYVQLLKELRRGLTSFAVLWDYAPPGFLQVESNVAIGEMKRAASALGVAVRILEIRTRDDLDGTIRMLDGKWVQALFVTNGPVQRQPETAATIMAFARRQRLPTMTDLAGNVFAAGCLTVTITFSPAGSQASRRWDHSKEDATQTRNSRVAANALTQGSSVHSELWILSSLPVERRQPLAPFRR